MVACWQATAAGTAARMRMSACVCTRVCVGVCVCACMASDQAPTWKSFPFDFARRKPSHLYYGVQIVHGWSLHSRAWAQHCTVASRLSMAGHCSHMLGHSIVLWRQDCPWLVIALTCFCTALYCGVKIVHGWSLHSRASAQHCTVASRLSMAGHCTQMLGHSIVLWRQDYPWLVIALTCFCTALYSLHTTCCLGRTCHEKTYELTDWWSPTQQSADLYAEAFSLCVCMWIYMYMSMCMRASMCMNITHILPLDGRLSVQCANRRRQACYHHFQPRESLLHLPIQCPCIHLLTHLLTHSLTHSLTQEPSLHSCARSCNGRCLTLRRMSSRW